jgi:hypothetical protein
MIGLIILLSGLLPGAHGRSSRLPSSHDPCINVNITGVQHVDLPVRGANYNPFDVSATKRVDNIDDGPSTHTALLRKQLSATESSSLSSALVTAASKVAIPKGISSLPIFHAALDSGCTGSCTGYLDRLINIRPCKEVYAQANGRLSYCQWKGDMPVFVKTSAGTVVSLTISNVRYVPDFKYTLLSVKQLWREQSIDARFGDRNRLELPSGNITIPYPLKDSIDLDSSLEEREARALDNMRTAIDVHEIFERCSIRNHKSFMPHGAIFKVTRDILTVGDIWAYCLSALELQNAETKRIATSGGSRRLQMSSQGQTRRGAGQVISLTAGYSSTMAISTLRKLLGAKVLRRGDGIIALPESRRKERLLAGRTKLTSKMVKMEILMRDYDPRLDTAIKAFVRLLAAQDPQ